MFMQNQHPLFYSIAEVCTKTGIAIKTIHRYIKEKKIQASLFQKTYRIPEDQLRVLETLIQIRKTPVVITPKDLETDPWLKTKANLLRLKQWSEGLRIEWNKMTLEDVVRYWRYLIFPQWKADPKYRPNTYPINQWISTHGFETFKRSFEKRYFKPEGINTLANFWAYLHDDP